MWDSADRLQAVLVPGEGTLQYTDYQWQQAGTIRFPGGSTRTQTFDGLQRHQSIQLTGPSGQTLMDYVYAWDETGNITQKATEHGIYNYGYDDIDRLTEADYPTFPAEEWTYDPLGNRLTDTGTGEAQWEYNKNNELLNSIDHHHEYDANGSLIAELDPDGSLHRSFEYNAENRMSAVRDRQGRLIAEYRYDPFGRRIQATVHNPPGTSGPETTWYVYSDQGLMAELDESGIQQDFYLFPPDGLWSTDPILRTSGSTYYYYQTDHLGTPQQLIDQMGNVVHSREMRAFGETAQTGIDDRWRFPGQLASTETGLYYNYFRDYKPRLGRYVQTDPIGLFGGANMFLYVDASPVYGFDPLGLCTISGAWSQYPTGQVTDISLCTGGPRTCLHVDNPWPWQRIRYRVGVSGTVEGVIECREQCPCKEDRVWQLRGSLSKEFEVLVPIPGANWYKRLPGYLRASCMILKYRNILSNSGNVVKLAKPIAEAEVTVLVAAVAAVNDPTMWCNAARGNLNVRFRL